MFKSNLLPKKKREIKSDSRAQMGGQIVMNSAQVPTELTWIVMNSAQVSTGVYMDQEKLW
jgi:hypothetical protein